jgi:lipid-A-disaccharide synthase
MADAITGEPFRLFVATGEPSGDALAAAFIAELRRVLHPRPVDIAGIGGEFSIAQGLVPLFPMTDLAVMGLVAVVKQLPSLLRRIRETVEAAIVFKPDLVLTIDSPDFSLRVAKGLRRSAPQIPIVHWVCPSVWAWRPGRAPRMRSHVDRLLALLPFEPEALARLGGPETIFVGHPLTSRTSDFRPSRDEQARRDDTVRPTVLLLPGSRRTEISRLLDVLKDVANLIAQDIPGATFLIPAVPHVRDAIVAATAEWQLPIEIVTGEEAKWAAFRKARAAVAASGTVTLELALSGVPTVSIYKVSAIEAAIVRQLIMVETASLPNLILGERVVPEFIQQDCQPPAVAKAALDLLIAGPIREKQIAGFAQLLRLMRPDEMTSAAKAVAAALDLVQRR